MYYVKHTNWKEKYKLKENFTEPLIDWDMVSVAQ